MRWSFPPVPDIAQTIDLSRAPLSSPLLLGHPGWPHSGGAAAGAVKGSGADRLPAGLPFCPMEVPLSV